MPSQDSTEPFERRHLRTVLDAVLEVQIAQGRTVEAEIEAEIAKRLVMSAAIQAVTAASKASVAVACRVENILCVPNEAIRAQAAAVRARISCFEAQLAAGRAEVWYNEASEALLRVEDAKDRMYSAVREAEIDLSRSDDMSESVVAAETAWLSAWEIKNKAYTELLASRGHVKIALYFASRAEDAVYKAKVALGTATRVEAFCVSAAAAAA